MRAGLNFFNFIIRFFFLTLFVGWPLIIVALVLFGVQFAVWSAISLAVTLLVTAATSEVLLSRFFRAAPWVFRGFLISPASRLPRIWLINSPLPEVFVARALGSTKNGSIFITQGLLDLLDENELRETLDFAIDCTRTDRINIRSLVGVLIVAIVHFFPNGWFQHLFQDVYFSGQTSQKRITTSLLGFLTLFPAMRVLASLASGQEMRLLLKRQKQQNRDLSNAMQKIFSDAQTMNPFSCLAAAQLSIFPKEPTTVLRWDALKVSLGTF